MPGSPLKRERLKQLLEITTPEFVRSGMFERARRDGMIAGLEQVLGLRVGRVVRAADIRAEIERLKGSQDAR